MRSVCVYMCLCGRQLRERERDVDGNEDARESEIENGYIADPSEKRVCWKLFLKRYGGLFILIRTCKFILSYYYDCICNSLDFQLLVQWIQISNYVLVKNKQQGSYLLDLLRVSFYYYLLNNLGCMGLVRLDV